MYDYPPYTGECSICNKRIKHEKSWIRHLKSKTHIKNEEKETQEGPGKDPVETQEGPKKRPSKDPVETQYQNKDIQVFICKYCNKPFKNKTHMYRHMKYRCKDKNIDITNHTTNNTTNNTTINTTNNTFDNSKNIHINIYGKEDLKDVLSIESYFEMINLTGTELLENFLKVAYIKHIENRNIKYTNLRSNDCKVLVAPDKWEVRNIDEVLDDRINKSSDKIKEMLKHFLVTSIPNDGEYLQKQLDQSDKASEDVKETNEDKTNFNKVKKNHKREIYNIS
jgi:hypothetical protein